MAPKVFLYEAPPFVDTVQLTICKTQHWRRRLHRRQRLPSTHHLPSRVRVHCPSGHRPRGFEGKYPNAKIIDGHFNTSSVLSAAALEVDIVICACPSPFLLLSVNPTDCSNSNHIGAIAALLSGLSQRTTPSLLLHLSGTAIIYDVFSPHLHFGGSQREGMERHRRPLQDL